MLNVSSSSRVIFSKLRVKKLLYQGA